MAYIGVHSCYGAWAGHGVSTPESRKSEYTPEISVLGETVLVRLPRSLVDKNPHRSLYLVTGKERLPPDILEFRFLMRIWETYSRNLELNPQMAEKFKEQVGKKRASEEIIAKLYRQMNAIQNIQPIDHDDGKSDDWIEVQLELDIGMRSYVVWDYTDIYEKGSVIMDGGPWITYDIPSYIEAVLKSDAQQPVQLNHADEGTED